MKICIWWFYCTIEYAFNHATKGKFQEGEILWIEPIDAKLPLSFIPIFCPKNNIQSHYRAFLTHPCTSVSDYSVVFGNSNGLAVVDYVQKTVVLNLGTVELYGSNDPYQRQPRSPRKTRQPSGGEQHQGCSKDIERRY